VDQDLIDIPVRDTLDNLTEGALYALVCEAKEHNWDAHIWAQKCTEGLTRFVFFATDQDGLTRYFDYCTAKDTGSIGEGIKIYSRMAEIKKATARIHEGLARLDAGLDPVPNRVATERLD
jgi:hypothetical protein